MDIRKLSTVGGSYGVTLPKDDLRELGVLDKEDELDEDQFLKIQQDGDQWTIELV